MKAASINVFGGPEIVTVDNVDLGQPGSDEAVVRVEAASINPLDLKMIAGYMQPMFPVELPYIPGTDFSGVVSSVGTQVTHLKPGDRVFGRSAPSSGGAFSQQLLVAASDLWVIPAAMSFEQAAALPTAFGTASQALFEVGQLKRGERVLIHAAAGGVGSMAVQLAHFAGAHVIATASARNIELVKSLGADEVINYHNEDFTALRDIDLVLDTLGGDAMENSWSVLGAGGRIATLVEFDIESREEHVGQFVFFASATPFLQEAVRYFSAGQLQIITDSIFALEETRAALEKVATGHARGKVIIRTRN
ncbi:NADP-dependent oxidoreductase [Pseudomonas sp. 10B1]|uniref:NADP-dependent oxidoreductase n=1 Tax=unclassified Pseudomonas TaxID=196821 RepID=UPI002AB4D794|nr:MULTISPECIES: NADP-dependent oxidoreductase [unclassified Pseudomonas]MDY7560560.1 NADP-dependent oxidoreductase [Pseudomonas sp. AB6]MEA9975846.1 NADP-dependent oxidoreductase [Pseudomonas sp. RTS4]MEA9993316.1 NADP-dependent oxidoreductase [Pseudomonas sp. AA4]MEB0088494.1 NADP-dependent oxidoreductase [Pseudomonas sp. RTI1]MEB0124197.1 NADP-dependent oxidoreductase [Pseudomonas sp. CCC1.2]